MPQSVMLHDVPATANMAGHGRSPEAVELDKPPCKSDIRAFVQTPPFVQASGCRDGLGSLLVDVKELPLACQEAERR